MGSNRKTVIVNSFVGMISQVISIVLQFATRSFFLYHIGDEILGINGTFASVMSTLSLAEMGLHVAITYRLYKPLSDKDEQKINDTINVYRVFFLGVAAFIFVASLLLLPFIQYILKGVVVDGRVYVYFLLQAGASIASYLLAYRRVLLFADQKDYVNKSSDTITSIVAKALQIIVILIYKDYIGYLILQIVQVVVSSLLINWRSKKMYPYLKHIMPEKSFLRSVMRDIKNVFWGKIAAYVFLSTDNLVISTILGTRFVTLLTNYTAVTLNLKMIISSLLNPLTPMIGKELAEISDVEEHRKRFLLTTHLRYLCTMLVLVPTYVLISDFVRLYAGAKYVLDRYVVILLVLDLYIGMMQGACSDYINGRGLFDRDKYIQITGALLNIALSVLLVWSFGIHGILLGTVASQLFLWIARSLLVYRKCFAHQSWKRSILQYIAKSSYYLFVAAVMMGISELIYYYISQISPLFLRMLFGGVVTEVVVVTVVLLMFSFTSENRSILRMLRQMVVRIRSRKSLRK